jgi:hypothetical protein
LVGYADGALERNFIDAKDAIVWLIRALGVYELHDLSDVEAAKGAELPRSRPRVRLTYCEVVTEPIWCPSRSEEEVMLIAS